VRRKGFLFPCTTNGMTIWARDQNTATSSAFCSWCCNPIRILISFTAVVYNIIITGCRATRPEDQAITNSLPLVQQPALSGIAQVFIVLTETCVGLCEIWSFQNDVHGSRLLGCYAVSTGKVTDVSKERSFHAQGQALHMTWPRRWRYNSPSKDR
jgi:hypothetical protein